MGKHQDYMEDCHKHFYPNDLKEKVNKGKINF